MNHHSSCICPKCDPQNYEDEYHMLKIGDEVPVRIVLEHILPQDVTRAALADRRIYIKSGGEPLQVVNHVYFNGANWCCYYADGGIADLPEDGELFYEPVSNAD